MRTFIVLLFALSATACDRSEEEEQEDLALDCSEDPEACLMLDPNLDLNDMDIDPWNSDCERGFEGRFERVHKYPDPRLSEEGCD